MSNTWFRFKLFTVNQDKCAMKVTTDACLFGAWSSKYYASTLLDIGTGTGLLSLMYRQKNESKITAIELEENAYNQSILNFADSNWSTDFETIHGDFKKWSITIDQKFEVIICNPPFYQNQFQSPDGRVNLARHESGLTYDELISGVIKLLQISGSFLILLPTTTDQLFELTALKNGLYLNEKVLVREKKSNSFIRAMCRFSYQRTNTKVHNITIRNADDEYSKKFKDYLKDYYLYL